MNPLLAQAEELHRRGWRVALATSTYATRYFPAGSLGVVEFIDLGHCPADDQLQDTLRAAVNTTEFTDGLSLLSHYFLRTWPCYFDGMATWRRSVGARTQMPDVIVSDLSLLAGFCVAEALQVPVIASCPDTVDFLGPNVLPPVDELPWQFWGETFHKPGTAFWKRVFGPFVRLAVTAYYDYAESSLGGILNAHRAARGLPFVPLSRRLSRVPVIATSVFGVEYPRPLPPLIRMLGPMISKPIPVLENNADVAWLENSDLPVVYMSMGTLGTLPPTLVSELFELFTSGAAENHYRVLWKLKAQHHADIANAMAVPGELGNLRVVEWVDSQVSVIQHPKVEVFISHCGINSVYESLYVGTLVLCIPIFADQFDMSLRIIDSGTGLAFPNRRDVTAADVHARLLRLLDHDAAPDHYPHSTFRRQLIKAQARCHAAGGIEAAADWIAHVVEYGVEELYQPRARFNLVAAADVDALFMQALILYSLAKLILFILSTFYYCLCKCRTCLGGSTSKHKAD